MERIRKKYICKNQIKKGIGGMKKLILNENAAEDGSTQYWNALTPTSTIVNLGPWPGNNTSGTNYISYCWAPEAGKSAFGSYTGTGSAGNKVTTGFQPSFIMYKIVENTGDWAIFDAARGFTPTKNAQLVPNTSTPETGTASPVVDSTGFTLQASGVSNTSGFTYVYAAFA